MSIQKVADIVTKSIERAEDICSTVQFHLGLPLVKDENGDYVYYDDACRWIEVTSDYTIDELRSKLEYSLTGDYIDYYLYALENNFMEEDGHMYILAADEVIKDYDYYIDSTLEIVEQTEDLISVKFEGFDTGYEQQVFCSAELQRIDGVWKVAYLSHAG